MGNDGCECRDDASLHGLETALVNGRLGNRDGDLRQELQKCNLHIFFSEFE